METHKRAFNEFFWMWLASFLPVLVLVLFWTITENNEVTMNAVIQNGFLKGPIFAYVSTLLAPFLFVIYKKIRFKNDDGLSFGGLSLVLTFALTITSTILFYNKQSDEQQQEIINRKNADIVKLVPSETLSGIKLAISEMKSKEDKPKETLSTRDRIALICYFMALILFYYATFLNNKSTPDLAKDARQKSKDLKQHLDTLSAGN